MKKVYQKKAIFLGLHVNLLQAAPLLHLLSATSLKVCTSCKRTYTTTYKHVPMYVLLGTVQKSGHIRYVGAHCNILVCFRTIHGILSWKEFTTQLYKRKLNLQNFQQFSITFNHKNTTNFCTANFPLLNQRRTNGNLLKCNFLIEGKITNIIQLLLSNTVLPI